MREEDPEVIGAAPADTATGDALKVTARAAERASEVLGSTAGKILTREGRYYERLLHQLLTGLFVEGAMLGAELATTRMMAGMAGAAPMSRLPELEEAVTRVELEPAPEIPVTHLPELDVHRASEPTLPTAEVLRGRRRTLEELEEREPELFDAPTQPGGDDP